MADVAIKHVPGQPEGRPPDGGTVSGAGIRWAPPDPEVLDRVLDGLRRLP